MDASETVIDQIRGAHRHAEGGSGMDPRRRASFNEESAADDETLALSSPSFASPARSARSPAGTEGHRGYHAAIPRHRVRGISIIASIRLIICSLAVFSSDATVPVRDTETAVTMGNSSTPMKCWVFNHMNKSGGMTVRRMLIPWLSKHGLKSGLFDDTEWTSGTEFAEQFAERNFAFTYGGYTEGLRRPFGDKSCKWFTIFRHPVSRLVSAYFYCKKRQRDQLCANVVADAREMELLEFAEHWGNYGLRQFALSFMSPEDVLGTDSVSSYCHENRGKGDVCVPGWYRQKKYLSGSNEGDDCVLTLPESTSVQYLYRAEQILSNQYTAVGILEKWEHTMKLFDVVLDIPGFSWVEEIEIVGTQNKDDTFRSVEDEVLKEAYADAELKEFIWLDILLYEHAIAVHERQVREVGVV